MNDIFFDPSDHSYTSAYGKSFTPVTRIVSKTPRATNFRTLPFQDKVMKAAERGTMLHKEKETFIKTGDVGLFPTTEWFALNVYPKYTDWESEQIVYSDEEYTSYAGTVDAICKDKEDYLLFDFKFGGHETVDYQLSLYKRAFCKMRNVSPDRVKLFCIDFHDEDNIKVIPVRTIDSQWLDNLLYCYEVDLPYVEPHQELANISENLLVSMESIENQIVTLEKTLSELSELKDKYRADLYKAMSEKGMKTFDFGSIHVALVPPSMKTEFNLKKFKSENPDINYKDYEVIKVDTDTQKLQKDFPKEYLACISEKQSRSGYLKVTIKDSTEAI